MRFSIAFISLRYILGIISYVPDGAESLFKRTEEIQDELKTKREQRKTTRKFKLYTDLLN